MIFYSVNVAQNILGCKFFLRKKITFWAIFENNIYLHALFEININRNQCVM